MQINHCPHSPFDSNCELAPIKELLTFLHLTALVYLLIDFVSLAFSAHLSAPSVVPFVADVLYPPHTNAADFSLQSETVTQESKHNSDINQAEPSEWAATAGSPGTARTQQTAPQAENQTDPPGVFPVLLISQSPVFMNRS